MFGETVKIVLIRHGKPAIKRLQRQSASEFGAWLLEYDLAELDVSLSPSIEAIKCVSEYDFVVCSDLIRSLESAKLLNQTPDKVCATFREFKTPYASWKGLKLSTTTWIWLFRGLQLLGYSKYAESYADAKKRSEACAVQLMKLAETHDGVVFVGHGLLNWFIHKKLLKMGWLGPKKSSKKYWGFTEYSFVKRRHNET